LGTSVATRRDIRHLVRTLASFDSAARENSTGIVAPFLNTTLARTLPDLLTFKQGLIDELREISSIERVDYWNIHRLGKNLFK